MAATRFDVLGIGNAIVDVIARTDDAFLAKHQMGKGTMRLIDEAQAAGLYDAMGPAVEVSGGSAANTIVGAARKASSVRAITSTIALPMPRTSNRVAAIRKLPPEMRAHYSGRIARGNRAPWMRQRVLDRVGAARSRG